MLLRLAITLFLLAILSTNVFAQQTGFEPLITSNRLPSNTVNSIIQDKQGYLWFGTNDGLARFDGYGFYILKYQAEKPNTLSNSYISSLAVDKSNNIWIATNGGGVNKYNTTTEEITIFRKTSNKDTVTIADTTSRIYVDKLDRVWVGTVGEGLNYINQSDGRIYKFYNEPNNPNSISDNYITAIFQDHKNRIWVGTTNGLNLFDEKDNTFKRYFPEDNNPKSINNNRIVSIVQTSDNFIWICTPNGMCKYNDSNNSFSRVVTFIDSYKNDNQKNYNKIVSDKSDIIWIATNKGILRFDPKSESLNTYHKSDSNNSSLSDGFIREIFFDSENRMWIATLDKGVNIFDPYAKRFSHFNYKKEKNSSKYDSISAIFEDSSKTLWLGTLQNFIRYSPNNNISPNTQKIINELKNNGVRTFFESSSGLLWIGLVHNIVVYDIKRDRFITKELNLPQEIEELSAQIFFEDSKGLLWIGTFNQGLYKFNPSNNKYVSYKRDDKNPEGKINSNRVTAICEDKNGNFWIGTRNGLSFYDSVKDTFTPYKNDIQNTKTISSNFITSLYLDKSNSLWVATEQGLNKLDLSSKTFLRINETNSSLPNDFIYAILDDEQGCLWLSTNGGIVKYNPISEKFYTYDESDGLQDNEFNFYAYFKSKSGELFFGGVNGLNRFYPDKIKNNPYLPKIAITSLKASNEYLKQHLEKNTVPANYYLELPYNSNNLIFTFSAFNFTHPEKNKYKYKLEGHEQEWIEVDSTKRVARYSRLVPGNYVFRVIASNNDGLWNETGESVKIRIFPPWWHTTWAYFLYLITFSSALYGGHRYHLGRLEKRNLELEIKVQERTEEVNKKNTELESKNKELAKNYEELLLLNQKANRIFAVLSEALPGKILDNKYRLEEKIGSGGFGAVYRATHLNIKKEVAVKVFSPSPGNDSVENLERFQQEAISTCRVNHPNAVAVLDSGISSDGIPYLVMEMLQGHTLKLELRNNGRLSLERVAQVIIPICKVLAKAHSSGLIHRDIKPDNIFLHNNIEGEIIKVLDFGIAKLINPTESAKNNLVETEGLIGTPLYMAPERLALDSYDISSDIYSLGSVIYEMISGQAPFQKYANSLSSLMMAQLSETPISLKTLVLTLPDSIDNLVLRTLEKEPENRPNLLEIAQTFALAAGVEQKQYPFTENKQTNKISLDAIFDQATIIVANKTKTATDEISPSEQITLYNQGQITLLNPKKK
ncbi:MAG: protein kinase [Acidobacteria bacterium]|nr:protein kinase [Acidobacteriota bacterium]